MNTFKLYLQYAHHQHHEFDERMAFGTEVLKAFDEFDWVGEVTRAESLQRVSPTISVETADKLIWVSAAGTDYISEYSYSGVINRFFGLWKTAGRVTIDTQTFSREQAREALEYFVEGRHDELLHLYRG